MNPHGSPFLWDIDQSDTASHLDKTLVFCKKFFYYQMTHNIMTLDSLGLMESHGGTGVILADQTKQCQVVITPNMTSYDYRTVLKNITKEDFDYAIQHTFLLTMKKMPLIKSVYGIEREFERYYQRILRIQTPEWIEEVQNVRNEQKKLTISSVVEKRENNIF